MHQKELQKGLHALKVTKIIESGKIGEIYSFFGRYGFPWPPKGNIRFKKDLGGGILNDAGCYPICASRIIFDREPIGVMCQSTIDNNGVDVKTTIHLKYSNTLFAQMITGYGLSYQSSYSLWGTKGFLKLSRAYNIPANMSPIIFLNSNNYERKISIKPVNHFKIMIESFCDEINGREICNFNFEDDILKQAKVMDACRRSFKQNKFIQLKN
jgi:dTDP-3,4-didehydro-2,6-dideoxy-alpha-D-glucose 3-reductase